jgi:hypothetical protein
MGAQANFVSSGYTQCTWEEITLMDSSYTSQDSSLTFVSTRTFRPGQVKEFLGTEISPDSALHFFTIYFRSNKWRAVPRPSFSAAIARAGSPADFVIYAEGDGKTFPDAVDRGTRLKRLYQVNIIMFDWPSRVPRLGGIKNVHNTVLNTSKLGKQFHTLLLLVKDYKASYPNEIQHLTLFFHSLGNAVFKKCIEQYGTSDLSKSLVDNILLNAACIPARGHRKWMETLNFQDHVYIVYNRKDKTLRQATLLFGTRMLGCKPGNKLANNALYYNIHELAGSNHNYFLIQPLLTRHKGITDFYNTVFHARPMNQLAPDTHGKQKKVQRITLHD